MLTRASPNKPSDAVHPPSKYLQGGALGFSLHLICVAFILIFSFPFVQADDDQDAAAAQFANNLFTDFAPLLALFGEDLSRQYLSQSIDWVDDLLFAMAPLGILTIVVGAIRVAGYSHLRNFVGKAQEPAGISEVEFLSSTSEDVCEIWDKKGISRRTGTAPVKQILFDDSPGSQSVLGMVEAEFTDVPERPYITRRDKKNNPFSIPEDPEQIMKWSDMPPNLTLNAHAPIDSRIEIHLWTILGVLIQVGVIVFQAVVEYKLKWAAENDIVEEYAFPLACAGTIMVCTGVFICAQVIERSTKEVIWIPAERAKLEKKRFQVMWVQKSGSGDSFSSYAIYRNEGEQEEPGEFRPIWGSYRVEKLRELRSLNLLVYFGTILCTFGFPLQFIGLRGLHYSATLAQLSAMFIMSTIRTWVRRGLSEQPRVEKLEKGYELDIVALRIAGLKSYKPGPRFLYWKDVNQNRVFLETEESPVLELRAKLGEMTHWQNSHSEIARSLYVVILETLNLANTITKGKLVKYMGIDVEMEIDGRHAMCNHAHASFEFRQTIVLKFKKEDQIQWTSDPALLYHLEAFISLWMYSYIFEEEPVIQYGEKETDLATWLGWVMKRRLLNNDFLVIIGSKEESETLVKHLGVERQNIVEIGHKTKALDTKTLPRNYIPIFNQTGNGNPKEDEEPNFVPREHLFSQIQDLNSKILYAYKYTSSPAMVTNVSKSEREWRKYVKDSIERIFAQLIYTAVIKTLVNLNLGFHLSQKHREWLGRSFVREKLGTLEESIVCMSPAYNSATDKK